MKKEDIRAAIEFGKKIIDEYRKEGREVPSFAYARQLELYEELVKKIEKNN